MRALTICQPYAELIMRGEKVIENREWYTPYRGLFAIHAGKSRSWLDDGDEDRYPGMPFGAIAGTARLVEVVRVERLPPPLREHPHAHGPWCWVLRDVVRFPEPIPCRGSQGWWNLPENVRAAAERGRE